LIKSVPTMSKRKHESEDGDEFKRNVRPKTWTSLSSTSMVWSLVLYLGIVDYKGLFKLRSLSKSLAALIKDRFCGNPHQWDALSFLMTHHVVHPWDHTKVCLLCGNIHSFVVFQNDGERLPAIKKPGICSWFKMHTPGYDDTDNIMMQQLRRTVYVSGNASYSLALLIKPQPYYRYIISVGKDREHIYAYGYAPMEKTATVFRMPKVITLLASRMHECARCFEPLANYLNFKPSCMPDWDIKDFQMVRWSNRQFTVVAEDLKFDPESHPYASSPYHGKSYLECHCFGNRVKSTQVLLFTNHNEGGGDGGTDQDIEGTDIIPIDEKAIQTLARPGARWASGWVEPRHALADKIKSRNDVRAIQQQIYSLDRDVPQDYKDDDRLLASAGNHFTLQMAFFTSPSFFGFGKNCRPLDFQEDLVWSFQYPREHSM
jgi:hypothetical protein